MRQGGKIETNHCQLPHLPAGRISAATPHANHTPIKRVHCQATDRLVPHEGVDVVVRGRLHHPQPVRGPHLGAQATTAARECERAVGTHNELDGEECSTGASPCVPPSKHRRGAHTRARRPLKTPLRASPKPVQDQASFLGPRAVQGGVPTQPSVGPPPRVGTPNGWAVQGYIPKIGRCFVPNPNPGLRSGSPPPLRSRPHPRSPRSAGFRVEKN